MADECDQVRGSERWICKLVKLLNHLTDGKQIANELYTQWEGREIFDVGLQEETLEIEMEEFTKVCFKNTGVEPILFSINGTIKPDYEKLILLKADEVFEEKIKGTSISYVMDSMANGPGQFAYIILR